MTVPTPIPGQVPRKPDDDEIDVHALTHVGKVREENQDHFLVASIHKRVHTLATSLPMDAHLPDEDQRIAILAMVADGVGGGQRGAEASATALEAVMRYVDDSMACFYQAASGESDFIDRLQAVAIKAHEAIREKRDADPRIGSMATTLTLFLGVWPSYYVLQVGDSRHYLFREGTLTQVTRDQTLAQELVDQGILTRSGGYRSPLSHVLSSALGADQTVPVVTRMRADWHNVHLTCSDGLTKHVTDARIAEVLGSMTSARQAAEQLLQDALDGGGTDNITIIVGRAVPKR